MICVSLGVANFNDAIKLSSEVKMMEFRADLLNWSPDEYKRIIDLVSVSLYTYRPGVKSEEERLELYRFAIDNGADYIDVEMEASPEFIGEIRKMISTTDTDLILSYHNFEKTPPEDELRDIIDRCINSGADLAKIACMVNDYAEAAVLLSLYQFPGRKVVVGMGEKGKIVRMASVFLGAEFTFAAPDKFNATAPGQMTWQEMKEIINILKSES